MIWNQCKPYLRLAFIGALLLALFACGSKTESVHGALIDVKSTSISETQAITVRTDDGRELTFRIGPKADQGVFSPGHLRQHMLEVSKVTVYYERLSDGTLEATKITD